MIMQISKCRRLPTRKFKLDDVELMNTKVYKYLGVLFDSSGNFNQARLNMNDRGQKAMYKLKSAIDRTLIEPSVILNLFDKTVKPVCLYGSEIWGSINIPQNCSPREFINKMYSKLPIEKTNLSFMKWLLGVHKRTSNFGVFGDFGRYPLVLDVIINSIKYYSRLKAKRKYKSLINDCIVEAESVDSEGGSSWRTWIKRINKMFGDKKDTINLKVISENIRISFRNLWQEQIESNNKLRSYYIFKHNFQREEYIDYLSYEERSNLARFRLSAHNLQVERGRHARPVIPLDKRLCNFCEQPEVEDEYHALIKCEKYEVTRNGLFDQVQSLCSNFALLSDRQKFFYLMTSEGEILKRVGCFIKYVLNKHSIPKGSS